MLCCLLASVVEAGNSGHRQLLSHVALLSAGGGPPANTFFLTAIDIENDATTLRTSGGATIFSVGTSVASAYEADVRYDISRFYTHRPRIKFVVTEYLSRHELYFSYGIDSGMRSDKLEVMPALFLGVAKGFALSERFSAAVSLGGWIGGSVHESPCLDSYDREYWCPRLMAWSDYQPSYPKPYQYIDFRVSYSL